MFNKKRMVRECTNQVTCYNVIHKTYSVVRTKGINVLPRKDHHAAIFGKSMLIYGGQFENGSYSNELLNFDLEYYDWGYVNFKQNVEPFSQGACASVMSVKTKQQQSLTRLVSLIILFLLTFISFRVTQFLMEFTSSVEGMPKEIYLQNSDF